MRRGDDGIEMDLEEVKFEALEWIQLVHDRVWWLAPF